MEYCPGGELNGSKPEPVAAKIMQGLLKALKHCHASCIMHRDIKPGNIMFDADGEVKLIDFGMSV
jgi:serine/threonine-protein kinase